MALQLAGRDPGGLPQRFRGGAVRVGLARIGGAGLLKCAQADGDDDVDAESTWRRDTGDLAVFARGAECDEPGLEGLCKRIVDDSVADHECRHVTVALVEPDEERGVGAGDGGGEFEFRAADPVGGVRVAHVDQLCHRSDVVLGLVFAAWPTPPTSSTDP
jgi:hypothetical protein